MAIALDQRQDVRVPDVDARRPARNPDRARVRVPKAVRVGVLTTHVLASVGWFGVAVTVALVGAIGSPGARSPSTR